MKVRPRLFLKMVNYRPRLNHRRPTRPKFDSYKKVTYSSSMPLDKAHYPIFLYLFHFTSLRLGFCSVLPKNNLGNVACDISWDKHPVFFFIANINSFPNDKFYTLLKYNSLQTTILSLMKVTENYVTSNSGFSHNILLRGSQWPPSYEIKKANNKFWESFRKTWGSKPSKFKATKGSWKTLAISPFPAVFSKDLYCKTRKNKGLFGKGLVREVPFHHNITQISSEKETDTFNYYMYLELRLIRT